MNKLFRSRIFLAIETVYLIIIPLIIVKFYFPGMFIKYRMVVMMAGLVYICLVAKSQKITLAMMGFRKQNFRQSLKDLLPPTLFIVILCFVASKINLLPGVVRGVLDENSSFSIYFRLLIYTLTSVTLQELLYRGFYISRLELISKNRYFLVLYSSLIFAVIHIPFNGILPILTFMLGLLWGNNFLKYRNIWPLFISHGAIGGLTLYLVLMS